MNLKKIFDKIFNRYLFIYVFIVFCLLKCLKLNFNTEILTVFLLIFSFVNLLYNLIFNFKCYLRKSLILNYIFVLIAIISIFINYKLKLDNGIIRNFLIIIMEFLTLYIDNDNKNNNKLLKELYNINLVMLISIFLVFSYSIIGYFIDINVEDNLGFIGSGRLGGTVGMVVLSEMAIIQFANSIFCLFYNKLKKNFVCYFCIINLLLSIFVMFMTQARGSMIGIIFALFMFFIYRKINQNNITKIDKKAIKFFYLCVVIILFIFMFLVITDKVGNRLFNIFKLNNHFTTSGRIDIWKGAIFIFLHGNILFGFAFSDLPHIIAETYLKDNFMYNYISASAWHNTYFYYLINFGILGLAFLFGIIFKCFKNIIKIVKFNSKEYETLIYSFIFVILPLLINGLVNNAFGFIIYTPMSLMFFTTMGYINSISDNLK